MPFNTIFQLAALVEAGGRGARGGRSDAARPRPAPLLARRRRGVRAHERLHHPVSRPALGRLDDRPAGAAGHPGDAVPRARPARHRTRLAPPGRRRANGTRRSRGRRPRHARHRLGSGRRAVPRFPSRLHQRGHVVARRRRAGRAADHRRGLRLQPDQRGRRGRNRPAAPERRRPVAAARVPQGIRRGRPDVDVRGAQRGGRDVSAAPVASSSPTTHASSHPAISRRASARSAPRPASRSRASRERSSAASSRAWRSSTPRRCACSPP